MVRALIGYQLFVYSAIFAPALLSGNDAAIRDAQALKIGCIQIQRDYDVFGIRWMHRDILDAWPEYRMSAFAMMDQVEAHISEAAKLGSAWTQAKVA